MLEAAWKAVMRRKTFSLLHIPALLLWLISLCYLPIVKLARKYTQATKVGTPVISVGSITVGGSGKTPIVEFLAKLLIHDGYRVGIVSSGYRRKNRESFLEPGYRVVNLPVEKTGDEVMLLAHSLPHALFSVDTVKVEAAKRMAKGEQVDVIIVDDGFQHHKLGREIDIVTFDAALPRSCQQLLPYGVLREPMSVLQAAEVIVITRANVAKDITAFQNRLRKSVSPQAKYYAAHFFSRELKAKQRTMPIKYLDDKSVFLFAGVGSFAALKRQATSLSGNLVGVMEFADHQWYTQAQLERVKREAADRNADVILTTAKDWVKFGDFDFGREIYYLDLAVDLNPGEEHLVSWLKETLRLTKSTANAHSKTNI